MTTVDRCRPDAPRQGSDDSPRHLAALKTVADGRLRRRRMGSSREEHPAERAFAEVLHLIGSRPRELSAR